MTNAEAERDTLQHPHYPLGAQAYPEKSATPQGKELAEDPFTASMRETTKLEIINLNQ